MSRFKENFLLLSTPLIKAFSVSELTKISGKKLILPFYHAVNDLPPNHLKYLYQIKNIKQFISDLEILLKYYKLIDLQELIDVIVQNKIINQPLLHLTFDDGLSEFNNIIAPILLKKGIPATCFLNSGFIGNKGLFYRFKASIIIDYLHHQPAGSPSWKHFHEWCQTNNFSKLYYQKILLSVGYDRKGLLDELALMIGVNFNEYLLKNKPYLDEGQINKLILQGFTFGAHSIDHPEYRFLSEEEQIRQTRESINTICNLFNLDYRIFSFPFTDYELKKSFFDKIFEENIADITFGSAGIKKDSFRQNIQRFSAESKNFSMKETIKNELFYYKLLELVGKGKIKRD
jgi:peptidoglycan/xylan/chitin deacetylase (PgdA/CDA1 family)